MRRNRQDPEKREKMKQKFEERLQEAGTVCVLGHVSPDGDCVGSCLALYNYIGSKYPEIRVQVYLDDPSEKFAYLNGFEKICTDCAVEKQYDLCIVCDCAETSRIGKFLKYLPLAKRSFLIDHHMTNTGFCDDHLIRPEASSTCEVLFELLDTGYVDQKTAECIYTGLVHDTGVFKYSCTSRRTMEIAGFCMEKGIPFGSIIDDSFYSMGFRARKLLGTVLSGLQSELDGRMVYSVLDRKTMIAAGVTSNRETDGFIDNIRNTEGAVCAAFFYQQPDGIYKASLRSNTEKLSVAAIAAEFDGGGHKLAAGCFIKGNVQDGIRKIAERVKEQLDAADPRD